MGLGVFSLELSKDKETLRDVRKLKKLLKLIPEERRAIGESLLKEIAFMSSTLAELKKVVLEKGTTENFKQGKQEFMRESPALKSYGTIIQRYSLLYKQFADLLPKPEAADNTKDEIQAFLKKLE